jgi:hypothetical protein
MQGDHLLTAVESKVKSAVFNAFSHAVVEWDVKSAGRSLTYSG